MTNAEFYLEDLKTKFRKIKKNKYFLSYSGGKDSHLLYWFIKEYAPEFSDIEVVGVNTYMEHPEIRQRIYDMSDVVLLPALKPFQIKEKYGIPCFSKAQDYIIHLYQNGNRKEPLLKKVNGDDWVGQDGKTRPNKFRLNQTARDLLLSGELHKVSNYCCKYLKKKPAEQYGKETGKKPILGVRADESNLRKAKYTSCFTQDLKFTPLWDLTDEIEFAIYEQFNIPIPSVYKHVTRTGCMGCPYGSYKGEVELELSLLSNSQRKFVTQYFKESFDVLKIKYNKEDV